MNAPCNIMTYRSEAVMLLRQRRELNLIKIKAGQNHLPLPDNIALYLFFFFFLKREGKFDPNSQAVSRQLNFARAHNKALVLPEMLLAILL